VTPSIPARLPLVATLYHRPIEGTFHGGSLHFKAFVERLRQTLTVRVVAPPCRQTPGSVEGKNAPLIVGFRYLVTSHWAALRFLLSDGRHPRGESVRAIIAFDIYLVGVAALWSRIRRIPLVYYPQDLNSMITTYWRGARYRGGQLFHAVRGPLERLGLDASALVLVVSESTLRELESQGVPARKLKLCPLKRPLPKLQISSVQQWRSKLDLYNKIAIVFVGSFEYAPNVRAFRYIRSELAPRLAKVSSRFVILVAGVGSEAFVASEGPNLRVLGTVQDLDGLLYASQLGIAPMDVAGGTSGKIIDYVLHGLQTVATPEAALGVAASPYLSVATLAEFPARIITLSSKAGPPDSTPPATTIDDSYRMQYLASDDIRAIGTEVIRLMAHE
jgi:hypothetical protein